MRHVFLIGMPGAGKTWWGSRVAPLLKMPFTDLDEQMMFRYKETIPALFERYGKDGFRQREHDLLKLLITNLTSPTIIACGGGTPCFHDNLQLMKNAGVVFYLNADVDLLSVNLENNTGRPLLAGGKEELPIKLQQLLAERSGIYEQADVVVDVNQLELSTFEQIIRSCIKRL